MNSPYKHEKNAFPYILLAVPENKFQKISSNLKQRINLLVLDLGSLQRGKILSIKRLIAQVFTKHSHLGPSTVTFMALL